MSSKHRAARVKPDANEASKGESIVPFEANESEIREAAESDHRNPDEESKSLLKDEWRTCPNANGPQPGDFGDRG